MKKQYYVYISASKRNGTLYIGMTGDLAKRIQTHKDESVEGFTQKYHVHLLVYCEVYDSPKEAIQREKNLKAWQRAWKLRLIEESNPEWYDLSDKII